MSIDGFEPPTHEYEASFREKSHWKPENGEFPPGANEPFGFACFSDL